MQVHRYAHDVAVEVDDHANIVIRQQTNDESPTAEITLSAHQIDLFISWLKEAREAVLGDQPEFAKG
jgi:hypothetical protein